MKLLLMMHNILVLQRLCKIELNMAIIHNYSDTSGSLWKFIRDEIEEDVDLTLDANHIPNNSSSFKYKSKFYYEQKC